MLLPRPSTPIRWIGGVIAASTVFSGVALGGNAAAATPPTPQAAPAGVALPAGFSAKTFASSDTLTHPDDLTMLDHDVFVAYQNGVGSKGQPSSTGRTDSTVVEYTRAGRQLASWNLAGKIDGMSADTAAHRIVATVNEDGNSSLYTIAPNGMAAAGVFGKILGNLGSSRATTAGRVQHYRFSPSPLPHGGGTDSIAFVSSQMFITGSAPVTDANGTTHSKPALYRVTLAGTTATATPVLSDNAAATGAGSHKSVTLNLSDPDSSMLMPASSPRFAGQLLIDSQGDSEQVFLANPGTPRQSATVLKLNTQVDDTAIASDRSGTLLVTDTGTNRVIAITGPFQRGQVFTTVPSDSSALAGTLGRLDLTTGTVTPFGRSMTNPHGLLFVD